MFLIFSHPSNTHQASQEKRLAGISTSWLMVATIVSKLGGDCLFKGLQLTGVHYTYQHLGKPIIPIFDNPRNWTDRTWKLWMKERWSFPFGANCERESWWFQGWRCKNIWNLKLVGGWTNPLEKYSSKWVHLPHGSGWKLKKIYIYIYLKPPT